MPRLTEYTIGDLRDPEVVGILAAYLSAYLAKHGVAALYVSTDGVIHLAHHKGIKITPIEDIVKELASKGMTKSEIKKYLDIPEEPE